MTVFNGKIAAFGSCHDAQKSVSVVLVNTTLIVGTICSVHCIISYWPRNAAIYSHVFYRPSTGVAWKYSGCPPTLHGGNAICVFLRIACGGRDLLLREAGQRDHTDLPRFRPLLTSLSKHASSVDSRGGQESGKPSSGSRC